MFPLGFFRKLLGALTNRGARWLVHLKIVVNVGAHRVSTLEVVVVITMQNADSVGQSAGMPQLCINPLPETAKIGGDARGFEGNAFQRCVAPRLIIRRIERKVVGGEHIVVVLVENTVVAVQIAGNKQHLHGVLAAIVQA